MMVGNRTRDVKAADAVGAPTLAVLTAGFSRAELRTSLVSTIYGGTSVIQRGIIAKTLGLYPSAVRRSRQPRSGRSSESKLI